MFGNTILYIDIGDDINSKKNISYLMAAGHRVDILNLQEEAQAYLEEEGKVFDAVTFAANIKVKKNYDKIIIAAHGKQGDIEQCYSIKGETKVEKNVEPLFSPVQLAQFMKSLLLTVGIESFDQLILLVCYAARTKNLEEYAIKPLESFAYKFFYDFSNMSNFTKIEMIAGIAEIRVGEDGLLEVSTEEYLKHQQQMWNIKTEITILRNELVVTDDDKKASEIQTKIENLQSELSNLDKNMVTEALSDYGQVHYHADVPNHKCTIYIDTQLKPGNLSYFFSQKTTNQHQVLYEGDLVKHRPDDPGYQQCQIL